MDPIKNPYAPGAGSPPPALAGRDKQLDSFKILLERLRIGRHSKSLLIRGLRGVGKTVLLTEFQKISKASGFKTEFAEIKHGTSFKDTIARMTRRAILSLDLSEKAKDTVWNAARVFKAFTFKAPGGYELGIDVDALKGRGDSGSLSEDLSDLFVAIGEAARDRKTGVVFLLDEIQFLEKDDLEALIAATHKASQENLPLTVVGAGLPQVARLAGEAKSYAERLFDFPLIGPLDPAAAREALERPASDQGVTYAPTAVKAILDYTEGYPYFLQEYGKHAWDAATGTTISLDAVSDARPLVQAQLDDNFFKVRTERATPTELKYIIAMANLGKGPYKTGEIAKKLGKGSEQVAPTRGNLIEKGLVYSPSYGLTDFTVPQFDDFIRRTMPSRYKR